jgi:hypothetical protein
MVPQHDWELWAGNEIPQAIRKRWMPRHFFVRIAVAAKEIPMRGFNFTPSESRVKGVLLTNSRNAFSAEQTGARAAAASPFRRQTHPTTTDVQHLRHVPRKRRWLQISLNALLADACLRPG